MGADLHDETTTTIRPVQKSDERGETEIQHVRSASSFMASAQKE